MCQGLQYLNMYNICNIKCFAQQKPERNNVLLNNKQASKTSFQDVMHALLTPELNNCVHDLTQLRTWAGSQKQYTCRQKNECSGSSGSLVLQEYHFISFYWQGTFLWEWQTINRLRCFKIKDIL